MIINGTKVEGAPKAVIVTVKGKELKLTLVHIGADEVPEQKFTWKEAPEGVTIETIKVGNRVASTIKQGKKVIFEDLTAQSVFAVLNAAFDWSTGKSDGIYKKSNPSRKEAQKGAVAVVKVAVGDGSL